MRSQALLFLCLLFTVTHSFTITCFECYFICNTIQAILDTGATEQEAEVLIAKACTAANIESEGVCEGIVKTFGPGVWPIIAEVGTDPDRLCPLFTNDCSSEKRAMLETDINSMNAFSKFLPEWSMSKSGSVNILQLSDIHYDELYAVGSVTHCDQPLCCRPWNIGTGSAQAWGDYNCDLTLTMFESLLQHIASLDPAPDMIVWTGDSTAHDIWNETQSLQIQRLEKIVDIIDSYLGHIPIFPSMGNHDSFPVDQFSRKPKDINHHDDFEWLVSLMVTLWGRWLPVSALKTISDGGYYSALAKPGLRVVSLNTQWGDQDNFYLALLEGQGDEQFTWLEGVLKQARADSEKIIVLGHIPSGLSLNYNETDYPYVYVDMMNRYQDIIVGQFFGHTHDDQFEIVFDGKTPSSVIYIAPSVTTFSGHNPSYRIYEYDTQFNLLDYHQFWADLTQANTNNYANWTLGYSAKEAYGLPDLSAASWYNLVQQFKTNTTLFDLWHYHFSTGLPTTCSGGCRDDAICEMLSAIPGSSAHCTK